MNKSVVSFAVGFIFALGLGLSGMTQPGKVLGFLDVLGNWDPSLLFVMASALAVHMTAYRLIRRRASPLLASKFEIPTSKVIDRKLALGAAIFGVGWGLAGYCPGPALVSVASGYEKPMVFVIAMAAGMLGYRALTAKRALSNQAV